MPKLKVTRTGPLEITSRAVSVATIARRPSPSKAKTAPAELLGTLEASAEAVSPSEGPEMSGSDASIPAELQGAEAADATAPADLLAQPSAAPADLPGTPASEAQTGPLATPSAKAPTKIQALVALLRRPEGARLPELMAATGWQAHSVRGAMSGAIKKGLSLTITSDKVDGERVYRIPEAQA